MGRLPTDAEWEVMDETFHRHYWAPGADCGLAEGAAELLAGWQSAGRSQSLLLAVRRTRSSCRWCGRTASSRHFVRVDGRTGPSGGGKAEHMVRHLAVAGRGVSAARTVVIGDAVDDALAAAHVGARAVLYTGRLAQPGQSGGGGGAGGGHPGGGRTEQLAELWPDTTGWTGQSHVTCGRSHVAVPDSSKTTPRFCTHTGRMTARGPGAIALRRDQRDMSRGQ